MYMLNFSCFKSTNLYLLCEFAAIWGACLNVLVSIESPVLPAVLPANVTARAGHDSRGRGARCGASARRPLPAAAPDGPRAPRKGAGRPVRVSPHQVMDGVGQIRNVCSEEKNGAKR